VNDLLVEFFPDVLDYQFTARMEDQLDNVAQGESEWQPMLHEFYTPFSQQLNNARSNMPTMRQEEFVGRDCPETGHPLVIRYGRWGKFIGCSDYPDCRYTEPYIELTGVVCPQCGEEHGGELVVRKTRRGRTFFGCMRYPDCDYSTWKLPKQEKSTPTEDPEPEENPQPDYLTG
jgi:DNA topoisomerase-1